MEIIRDQENKNFIEFLEKFRDKDIEYFKKFQKENEPSFNRSRIIILGGPGLGKTFLTRNILKDFRYMAEDDMKQKMVAGDYKVRQVGDGTQSSGNVLEVLAKGPAVIYDDLGVADYSPAFLEKTMYWLNKRSEKKQQYPHADVRTVIVSNLTEDQIRKIDARLYSRIFENALVIKVSGRDRRTLNTKVIKL